VSILFGNKSGNALAVIIKNINIRIPEPATKHKYFNGYPPKKDNIIIITKINAVVEKLAGKIKSKTDSIGIHRGKIELLNEISSKLFFDKYLATNTIKTKLASVEG
jgi:uncharacterized protein (UPF0254 family)